MLPFGEDYYRGVCLPLTATRGFSTLGCGDALSLRPLVDFCCDMGFTVIQLLPLNDSGLDASPYNAQSAFALSPCLISIHDLPESGDYIDHPAIGELNELEKQPRTSLPLVRKAKLRFLRDYLEKEAWRFIGDDFVSFCHQHHWLRAYCAFCILKERFSGAFWKQWPTSFQEYSPSLADSLPKDEMQFYALVQFLASMQLQSAHAYATECGVRLIGDIPILISPDSADVWAHRGFFDMSRTAGAPPDYYSPQGQNWGFPLYRWAYMEKDNFSWWRARLQHASAFYDFFRIDHIVGFFRIWAIALGKGGRDGAFDPVDEKLWLPQGEKLLRMMCEASSMQPIGEDLGAVPDEVRQKMVELKICGTKVMRWERRWKEDKKTFIDPKDYPKLSLCCVSTHDSETLAQWWRDLPEEASQYARERGWPYTRELTHDQRRDILRACFESEALFQVNLIQEYLALVPSLTFSDIDAERINTPNTISDANWNYRLKSCLEELAVHSKLRAEITQLFPQHVTSLRK